VGHAGRHRLLSGLERNSVAAAIEVDSAGYERCESFALSA
jgi:hypothetical protein